MLKRGPLLKVLTEPGPSIVLVVAIALFVGVVAPASAQFFNFGGGGFGGGGWSRPSPRGGGWFGGDLFAPFQQQAPKRVYQDFSKAPPPEKRDTNPERNVMVMGDGMADWLAYGLEDAYTEQPDMGVVRKAKNTSGLIRYQPKGDPADWAAAAKGILATEKPDIIVVMLGLNDRVAMREPASEKADKSDKADKSTEKKNDRKDAHAKGDPADWASAAKGILTTEKPDIIVVMLGLNDRVAIREPVTEKNDSPADKKSDKAANAKGDAKSGGKGSAKPEPKPEAAPKADTRCKSGNSGAAALGHKMPCSVNGAAKSSDPAAICSEQPGRSAGRMLQFVLIRSLRFLRPTAVLSYG